KLRESFQNHVVLAELRVDRGNLPLPESIVESFVDELRRNAQARSSLAVDDERLRQPIRKLVRRQIADLRKFLQPIEKATTPKMQLFGIRVRKRVLKLSAAHPILDRQILNGLHIKPDAINIRKLGLKPSDHLRGRQSALTQTLQIDLNSARA